MSQSSPSQTGPIVIRQAAKSPPDLPSLAKVFDEAKVSGWRLTVVLRSDNEPANALLLRRRHDLMAAVRTLDLSVKALTSGYRFDDAQSEAKIAAMQRAVQCLEREIGGMSDLLLAE